MNMPVSDPRSFSSHLRSGAVFALLLAFALLQGIAPLLHVHVGSATGLASGVHLPDGVAAVPHAHSHSPAAEAADRPCALQDGALVTAAAEHRRDDTGPAASWDGRLPATRHALRLPVTAGKSEFTAPRVPPARNQSPPPHSHGPPALA